MAGTGGGSLVCFKIEEFLYANFGNVEKLKTTNKILYYSALGCF